MTKPTPAVVRFWVKVDKNGPVPDHRPDLGPCWIWTGARIKNDYGQFYVGGKPRTKLAHRFSYEISLGPIPDGLSIDHLCRNHSCVNPLHLEPVTHAVNVQRGISGYNVVEHWVKAETCKYGHPWTEENTLRMPKTGRRRCYTCYLDRSRELTLKRQRERHQLRGT